VETLLLLFEFFVSCKVVSLPFPERFWAWVVKDLVKHFLRDIKVDHSGSTTLLCELEEEKLLGRNVSYPSKIGTLMSCGNQMKVKLSKTGHGGVPLTVLSLEVKKTPHVDLTEAVRSKDECS